MASLNPEPWPDTALRGQAASIGPALLQLIDFERRWVHRRVERIELLNATQIMRSVSTDLTVPVALQSALGLYPAESQRSKVEASRFVVPVGILPKGPLEDISLSPADVHRLSAEQSTPLVVAALAPYAGRSGAPLVPLLGLARDIVRSEVSSGGRFKEFEKLLDEGREGEAAARSRIRSLVKMLNSHYILLAVVKTSPGMPLRITYAHRQIVKADVGSVRDTPVVMESDLPYASGPGPAYRLEVVAPDGLEIETASIAERKGTVLRPVVSCNTAPGHGAFVHLRAPDAGGRPKRAELQVRLGWPSGSIHHIATIAGVTSTVALLTATLVSFWLGEKMKGSSAGTLLAAPALVSGLALGFATTRVTSKAANRLRAAAFAVALIGVAGALGVSLLGETAAKLGTLQIWLIGCTLFSALITAGYPVAAVLRKRDSVLLEDTP